MSNGKDLAYNFDSYINKAQKVCLFTNQLVCTCLPSTALLLLFPHGVCTVGFIIYGSVDR